MARADGRIEKGQRLSSAISAKAWNRAQQAADVVLGVQPGAAADGQSYGSAPYQWVYAKNVTGVNVPRWGVMAITGFEVSPTSDDAAPATTQFQQMPVLRAGNVATSTTAWCVAVEPIANDSVGKVAVSGVVQVRSSELTKIARSPVLFNNATWALISLPGTARLGTISSTWNKGASATVTERLGDGTAISGGPTFSAVNHFATVTVTSGTKRVACALIGSTWVLIAAEC